MTFLSSMQNWRTWSLTSTNPSGSIVSPTVGHTTWCASIPQELFCKEDLLNHPPWIYSCQGTWGRPRFICKETAQRSVKLDLS
jgi:hypothetical protein